MPIVKLWVPLRKLRRRRYLLQTNRSRTAQCDERMKGYISKEVSPRFARTVLPEILRDPYRNAMMIADIMQLHQSCDYDAAFEGDRLAGLISYYNDLPFRATGLYCPDPGCLPDLLANRSLTHPEQINDSFYALLEGKLKDALEKNDLLFGYSEEYRMRYIPGKIELRSIPTNIKIARLSEEDLGEISKLYSIVPAVAWTPKSLVYGPYYGAFDGSKLVSIAGVHFNTKYVAEVGNIVTMPMYQNRGLGRAVTQAVINELMRGSRIIFLCVLTGNITAIHLYLQMGFEITDTVYLCKFSLASSYASLPA